jgi:hypothetical protein
MTSLYNINSIDTNVANYTIPELMQIAMISELNSVEIIQNTNKLISHFSSNSDGGSYNPVLVKFFTDVQNQLLIAASNSNSSNSNSQNKKTGKNSQKQNNQKKTIQEQQVSNWIQNEYLKQDDSVQRDKVTDRDQKIDILPGTHDTMKQQQLGVSNTYNVEVAQDNLNPTLKNTINRLMNLDSRYRQSSSGNNNYNDGFEGSSTNYTLDLSDPLVNVLSIRLYSYQIPFTWYNIDVQYGNTCFWITQPYTDGTVVNIPVTIPSGNYNSGALIVTALNQSFVAMGFGARPGSGTNIFVSYSSVTGKITFDLYGAVFHGLAGTEYEGISFTVDTTTEITFFDFTATLQCNPALNKCVNKTYYMDESLGWLLGFRVPFLNVAELDSFGNPGNTGVAVLNLYGTKYLILVIDDFNQNHINNTFVTISETSKQIKLPSYYSPDLPYVCLNGGGLGTGSNINSLVGSLNQNTDAGLLIEDKANLGVVNVPVMVPSAPRVLTQSQIYTINEIMKNNLNRTNYKTRAPTNPDMFSIIPIKTYGVQTGGLIVEFGGTLQDNKRTYFGPVNIERLKVQLLDDKGNVLNLNGADWSINMICECLYKY